MLLEHSQTAQLIPINNHDGLRADLYHDWMVNMKIVVTKRRERDLQEMARKHGIAILIFAAFGAYSMVLGVPFWAKVIAVTIATVFALGHLWNMLSYLRQALVNHNKIQRLSRELLVIDV